MRIDLGYILGYSSEFVLILYYISTTAYPQKSYFRSTLFAFAVNLFHFVFGMFQFIDANCVIMFLVWFLILKAAYRIKCQDAAMQSMLLLALSMVSESIAIGMTRFPLSYESALNMTSQRSMQLTVISKLLFLIGILLMKHFMRGKKGMSSSGASILIVIPLISIIGINIMIKSSMDPVQLTVLCVLLLLINIGVIAANDFIISKDAQIDQLMYEKQKSQSDLAYYKDASEKYEQMRMLRHDFKEQISVLNSLIASDNAKAKEYIQSIGLAGEEVAPASYTNNPILNILLTQKLRECEEKKIHLYLEPVQIDMNFLSEIDTVTIFSNLINNAIESCEASQEKSIFLDVFLANDAFATITIKNSADTTPFYANGHLQTNKSDKEVHGIGIKSIQKTLEKYNGEIDWSYDTHNRVFKTVIIINTQKLRSLT